MATARVNNKADLVWALHTFEAENDDELAFSAGERIIVLERDDQYGDGWFQGRNERGEVGLFPQSYTSSRPPSFFPSEEQSDSPLAASVISPPTSALDQDDEVGAPADIRPTQHETLSPTLGSLRRDSISDTSEHSQVDDDDLDAPAPGANGERLADGAAHRAALAATAMENAQRDAQEERERAERRRREDEELYERRKSGFVEGLQLSDESEDEEEPQIAVAPATPAPVPHQAGEAEELHNEGAVEHTDAYAEGLSPARPRADTQASAYAESVYSNASSAPPVLSPPAANTDVANTGASSPSGVLAASEPAPLFTAASVALPGSPVIDEDEVDPAEILASKGDETPRSPTEHTEETAGGLVDTLKSASESTAVALSAGAAGLAAAVGAAAIATGAALQGNDKAPAVEPIVNAAARPLEEEKVVAPVEAQAALDSDTSATAAAPPPPQETALPISTSHHAATPAQATAADAAVESSAEIEPAVNGEPTQSEAADLPSKKAGSASAAPGLSDTAPTSVPPPLSPTSAGQSGAGTAATGGALLSSSVRPAATKATVSTVEHTGHSRPPPTDPMTWSVEDVVEWAKQKGFDDLTVSKFEEHEISGDVLLEMDVAMLKEIDLIAFGRRVHIFNAIKELRLRSGYPGPAPALNASQSTSGGSVFSPALSGYEPDSPTTYAHGSPVAAYHQQTPQARWEQEQGRNPGLGFDDVSAPSSLRSPSSLGQQSVSNLRSSRSIPTSLNGAPPTCNTHTRSTTVDSMKSAATPLESVVTKPIPEEPVAESGLANERGLPNKAKSRPSPASSLQPRSSRRDNVDKSAGEGSATSTPSSPVLDGSQKRKASKDEKASFFGSALPLPGRNRKPPPRVPSALLINSDGAVARPRPRSSYQDRAKRSTRLFSSFGAGSGSDKASPTALESPRSRPSNSTYGGGRDAPTTMTVKTVDPATKEMVRETSELVTTGNLMDKIGRPDHSGWMRKRGEKYNTWKMRFFVLKGTYLYYLKSEAEQKAKGFVDLTGYRVIADPSIHPGEYGFKIVHDGARTHFFAAAEQITVRTWMKEIMKATILRDYSAPVVSSCDIEVLPLETAKSMIPYPRPPTPTRRAEIQKARYGDANPNTLSQKDAAILMDFAPGSPLMNGEALFSSVPSKKRPSVGSTNAQAQNGSDNVKPAKPEPQVPTPAAPVPLAPAVPADPVPSVTAPRPLRALSETSNAELLAWFNQNLPASCPLATDLSLSLRSGRLLVRLMENLSGDSSDIADAKFDEFHQQENGPFDTAYLDTIFSVFDFLTPRVSTEDVSMEDMIAGREPRMALLVSRIRAKYQPEAGLA